MNKTIVKENTEVSSLKPTGNQLFLEYEIPEQKTSSGIILVADSTDKNQKNYVGKVLAYGDKVPLDTQKEIPLGSRVVFAKGRQFDLNLKPSAETAGFPSHCFVSWYDILVVAEGSGTVIAH